MFLQSDLLLSVGGSSLVHGFFDRQDGISNAPFRSLNISFHVGDDPANVLANRAFVKETLKINHLVSARQVHGKRLAVLNETIDGDIELDGYDGLFTNQKGVGLMIQQADCQAVLLFDPVRLAIGALHCGWRGSVADIISSGIQEMVDRFGSKPAELVAAISPSLGPCCSEFLNHNRELPPHFHQFQIKKNHFDFWHISVKQLIGCGLMEDRISVSGLCSCCHPDFFSYRSAVKAGSIVTGRNCSVICLTK